MQQTQQPHSVVLSNCPEHFSSFSVTTPLPASDTHVMYTASSGNLYALSARNGALLWCKKVSITGNFPCPGSCPAGPFMNFGEPAVVGGVAYVCASGYQGYMYAFRARDGSLLWSTKSNCATAPDPVMGNDVPLVYHNVVYAGSDALRTQDGKLLWSTPADTAFQALDDGVLYAAGEVKVYALNAKDGAIRWHYQIPNFAPVTAKLIAGNKRVYFGTESSADTTVQGGLYVLNSANGSLSWKVAMSYYGGVSLYKDLAYVSSGDHSLDARQANSGALRWRYKSASSAYNAATSANGVLYINIDGPYALNAATGKVIWHQSLGASQSVEFTPITIVDNVLYFARIGGDGKSTIYAMNAHTGAIYWQGSAPELQYIIPLTVI
ncbi:hypothetical protein KDW_13890 [Dictyobacter vulcani]|uniref:Pyrrolo-quinoline quinone repeat domain-containing protein n=2 Tax=Dictyobacter vulcani TaxID=2607529 RepID=A0A5J4KLE6_9CHLR|nr:hypothetical protein KDW_13890 [Dictyobacter vulcani]